MLKRIAILTCGILLLFGFMGEVMSFFGPTGIETFTKLVSAIGRIAVLALIFRYGNIFESRVFLLGTLLFCTIAIIGILFKIQEYAYGLELIIAGFLGIAVVYVLRFMAKRNRVQLDYLKVLWVLLFSLGMILNQTGFAIGRTLLMCEGPLFLYMFAHFAYRTLSHNTSK